MADEIENQNDSQDSGAFDASQAAAEYEAERGPEAESQAEEAADELDEDDGEASDNSAEPESASDEDNDEEFLNRNKGRAIPYSAFQKKYQKWKERETKAIEQARKLQDEFEGYKRSAQSTPEQAEQFKRFQFVFGNLDKAASSRPWLTQALLAMGRGEEPDWRALNQALAEHVKTLPQGDPVLARQVQELYERQQAFEQERFSGSIQSHVQRENEEIRKLLGDDQVAWRMLNQIAAESVPERGDVTNLPNRVEIAKQILAWSEKRAQAQLKARVPAKPAAKAGIRAGNGPAARSERNDDPPEPGTEEYRRWAAGI